MRSAQSSAEFAKAQLARETTMARLLMTMRQSAQGQAHASDRRAEQQSLLPSRM